MAEILSFDTGVKEFIINGVPVRFNPSDPNLYSRFSDLQSEVERIESDFSEKRSQCSDTADLLTLTTQYDKQVKSMLSEVFGGADMDAVFGGASVISPTDGGNMAIKNFFDCITPIIQEGVKEYAKLEAVQALSEIQQ